MKKIIILASILIVLGAICFQIYKDLNIKENKIDDSYIMIFHNEDDTVRTYIYKTKATITTYQHGEEVIEELDQPNMGFRYVNTKITKKGVFFKKEIEEETDRGDLTWTDDCFSAASKNKAYAYVTDQNNKKYSIEEYMGMFLMN